MYHIPTNVNTAGTLRREAAEPAWKRLDHLLATRRDEILLFESSDDGLIHVYDCGDFVAFERSACLLHSIFPDADITILHLHGLEIPLVMLSVPSEDFLPWSRIHPVKARGNDLTILPSAPLPSGTYARWHRDAIEGNL